MHLIGNLVPSDRGREPDAAGALTRSVNPARREADGLPQQLGFGDAWIAHQQQMEVAADLKRRRIRKTSLSIFLLTSSIGSCSSERRSSSDEEQEPMELVDKIFLSPRGRSTYDRLPLYNKTPVARNLDLIRRFRKKISPLISNETSPRHDLTTSNRNTSIIVPAELLYLHPVPQAFRDPAERALPAGAPVHVPSSRPPGFS